MYAEVYKWFTETSGLGLSEQAAKLMHPKQAAKEEDIAEAIELWEEKVNRLARHGEEFQLNEAFKKVALKKILMGKVRDNFDLWQAEKMSFEELLRKVKEQARPVRNRVSRAVEMACRVLGVAQGCTDVKQIKAAYSWQ